MSYYVVANWRDDPTVTYCSSPSGALTNADTCRYVNYPLQYEVKMVPLSPATGPNGVAQTNAKPPGSQGQATTYHIRLYFQSWGDGECVIGRVRESLRA